MSLKQILIALAVLGPAAAAIAAYVGLVNDGTLPPPNWDAIGRIVNLSTTTVATLILAVCVAAIGLLVLFAPVVYAIRAHDPITVLISLVMTGGAIAFLLQSRTVMDQISALIIFLANITLSGAVYAAHRIAPKP
jgi:hypothetical protein